jgi:hypothetical protein
MVDRFVHHLHRNDEIISWSYCNENANKQDPGHGHGASAAINSSSSNFKAKCSKMIGELDQVQFNYFKSSNEKAGFMH